MMFKKPLTTTQADKYYVMMKKHKLGGLDQRIDRKSELCFRYSINNGSLMKKISNKSIK